MTEQTIECKRDDYDEDAGRKVVRFVTDLRAKDAGIERYATFALSDGVERKITPDEDAGRVLFHGAKGTFGYTRIQMSEYLHGNAKSDAPIVVTLHEA